jgi:hypothetical protein
LADDEEEDEQQSPIDLSKSSSSFRRQASRPTLGWLDLAKTAPFILLRHTTVGNRFELRKLAIFRS